MIEHRNATRLNLTTPCLLHETGHSLSVITENLSLKGTLVHMRHTAEFTKHPDATTLSEHIKTGDTIKCQFLLDSFVFTIEGTVTRVDGDRAAIAFEPLCTAYAMYLSAIVAKQQQPGEDASLLASYTRLKQH